MKADTRHLASLDMLRGIAALAVAVPHFFVFIQLQTEAFEAISVLGVEIFFVLSGFVLAPQILHLAIERPSLANLGIFLVRRWIRTIPAYLLALVIMSVGIHTVFTADFLRYVFYIQNLTNQANANDYFSVAWSLSVEEWFYLVFPLVIFAAAATIGRSLNTALAGTLLFIATVSLARTFLGDFVNWGPEVRRVVAYRIDSIAFGFLLYLFLKSNVGLKNFPALAAAGLFAAASLAGVFLTIAIERTGASSAEHAFPFAAAAIGSSGIVLALKLNPLFEGSPTLTSIGLYLGRISYSVYLFHLLVLTTLSAQLAAVPWLVQIAVFILATALIATLVYEAIEKPILRVRPKFHDVKIPSRPFSGPHP